MRLAEIRIYDQSYAPRVTESLGVEPRHDAARSLEYLLKHEFQPVRYVPEAGLREVREVRDLPAKFPVLVRKQVVYTEGPCVVVVMRDCGSSWLN
jgi:hypothetical protein